MIPASELSLPFDPAPASQQSAAQSLSPRDSVAQEAPPTSKVEASFTHFWGGPRCREKGCVFPARSGARGLCQDHARQRSEPAHYLTCQPTLLLLRQRAFGISDSEGNDSRAQDRLGLAAQCEAFREGLA